MCNNYFKTRLPRCGGPEIGLQISQEKLKSLELKMVFIDFKTDSTSEYHGKIAGSYEKGFQLFLIGVPLQNKVLFKAQNFKLYYLLPTSIYT